ncbi:MAG: LmbE family protein [Acidobacteriaceae bacterium]|nr:LmbE family protein [Acidobacteriaceae bacterium]
MMKNFALRHSTNAVLMVALLTGNSAGLLGASVPEKQITDATPIPPDRGAAATWQLLKKLHTRASLLMIVAHPDDEDGATLAYEGRGVGVRTNLMQLNRGEGGANVMSSDYWDALGLVRTEELLQAGRYYGIDRQYFSTAADYGFSKSLKEAVDQWGHDRELAEAVRVVRMTRPLIVCSVFVGGPTDGHGHHATAGLLTQEVFKAAGDPKMFPEQIKEGLQPWEPVKVYARVPFFRTSEKGSYDYANHVWGPLGVTNHVTGKWEPGKVATTLAIPVGTFDELVGQTYLQIAREGLGYQKSQNGGGEVPLPGPQGAMYHRFGSHIDAKETEETLFDGIDTSLQSIAILAGNTPPEFLSSSLSKVNGQVEGAMKAFTGQNTATIAPALAEGMTEIGKLIGLVEKSSLKPQEKYNILFELRVKQRQFNDALVSALGLSLEADVVPAPAANGLPPEFRRTQTTFQMATPGKQIHVNVHLFDGGKQQVEVKQLSFVASSGESWKATLRGELAGVLQPGKAIDALYDATIPADEPYSKPYFTRANLGESRYTVSNKDYFGMPLAPYPLEARAQFAYHGVVLSASKVVQVVSRVEGPGVLRYPMPVGPPVSVGLSPSAGVLPMDLKSFPVSVHLLNNLEGKTVESIHLKLPEGWRVEPSSVPVNFEQAGEERSVSFTVYPKATLGSAYEITAVADLQGKSYSEGYVKTGYLGLRPYFLYSKASYRTIGSDVKVAPNQKIGYIDGSGDDVPASLAALGVHVSFLTAQDLSGGDLSKYDTILVGVRAYAVRPDLVANNSRLLEYVKNGGVVMVQYNTPEFDHNFGPYPYVMTNDPEEVTNEHSVVQILDAKNPLFTWPNPITSKDFEGWIEERGSKFLSTWDPKYTALLETHDEGQPAQKGGLVYARYGKGAYIYNAYAFYRELPLGVPGAYRLFANMISLPQNPDFQAGR